MSSVAKQSELTSVLDVRYALGWRHVAVTALFAALFLYLAYIPLWHTDLWGHVVYGNWILDHRALPAEDPFLPLAEGMRVVDNAWLAQIILAVVERWGGAQALASVFASLVLATSAVLARVFFLQTRRLSLSVAGAAAVFAMAWSRHAIVRPENFAALCFAVLLWLVVRAEQQSDGADESGSAASPQRRAWALWGGIPLVMLLWANVHGSYLCGVAVLGCCWLGRVLEVIWQSRSLRAVLCDRLARQWMWLAEAGLGATLINPYGIDLLIETVQFARNENLRDVMEWYPLVLASATGSGFVLSWTVLTFAWRHSRRSVRPVEILLLGTFGALAAAGIRMIGWYAPVAVLVAMPHLADLINRVWPRKIRPPIPDAALSARVWRPTLCCLLLLWVTFAFSPLSRSLLGGNERPSEKLYSRYTPLGLTAYLRSNPPQGQIWNPQWWGDWLAWDGPSGLKVFAATHVHLTPRRVWRDYMQVAAAQPGWELTLDRYGVTTLVVHKELQRALAAAARASKAWTVQYEDELAIVLARTGQSASPDAYPPPDACCDDAPAGKTKEEP
jgi:hypothetical protein